MLLLLLSVQLVVTRERRVRSCVSRRVIWVWGSGGVCHPGEGLGRMVDVLQFLGSCKLWGEGLVFLWFCERQASDPRLQIHVTLEM